MSEPRDPTRQPETETSLPLEQVQHPETMYDRSDLSSRAIFMFLVALAATCLVILLIAWGLLRYFAQQPLSSVPRTAAIVTPTRQISPKGDPAQRFPAPQLQPDPVADLNKFRTSVEERLNSYGWVDQDAGIAHIPIEKAIDMMSQTGLPARQPPALPPRAGFASGDGTTAGAGGGTEPKGNQ
ncbi:MAG: hypothetical protein ACR2IF_02100 [Terriglobales bacterium]